MLTLASRLAALLLVASLTSLAATEPIDRYVLVKRHDPVLREFDVESPLSVGNGQFAFTADVTGLQTFAEAFEQTIPLGTLSDWGWHTAPNPDGWSFDRYELTPFDSHGRAVGYADIPGDQRTPEVNYLRENPHRLHLGRIRFQLLKSDGSRAAPADLTDTNQKLDLWLGLLVSHFQFEGQPVDVETVCHPTLDLVAVRVKSPLVAKSQLGIEIEFPYGTSAVTTADWDHPGAHRTEMSRPGPNAARFARTLDSDSYHVAAQWSPAGTLTDLGNHRYALRSTSTSDTLEFVCQFTPDVPRGKLPTFGESRAATTANWQAYWRLLGAIDLSKSRDPRWRELERRIVLSQYLTAIQCAGRYPPQETGLTYNSWYGKFHLEMHWWHAVHFALWNRIDLLERSLDYYRAILPRAEETAGRQGYAGARWPKMTDPRGVESPSTIGPFLIWQQPHPIYYAELCYRAHDDRATLQKYRDVVFETAQFMASFATWDDAGGRYVLGPPLQCAQEIFPKQSTFNPTFELTYWRWGLETAQTWRERLGLERDEKWDHVLRQLARPAVADGKYLFTESTPDSYTNPRWAHDHPSVTAALGVLPGPGIDPPTMLRTLDWVEHNWNWTDTWGWDYPMLAMCAARVGEPNRAIDFLLLDVPKNVYRTNGHNYQRPGLTVYLPGNGGLLAAAAMMAAGWDGAPDKHAPGFPDDGSWDVRWEGLQRMP
jgi:hypothetical protein